ncbi:MAG: hypothetical protein JO010_02680 [Alphaproteobacteria bacterium]|nr:hypothetical protein [Alphaproteobacteria bacterium]
MRSLLTGLLALAALTLAPGADAFSLDTKSGVNPDGTARFSDPDEQLPRLSSPANGEASSMTLFKSGPSSLSFGVGRSDDRVAPNPLVPFRGFEPRFGVRPGYPN